MNNELMNLVAVETVVLKDTKAEKAKTAAVAAKAPPQTIAMVLANLEMKRVVWEEGVYRTSNQALYELLAECLIFSGEVSFAQHKERNAELKAFYAQRGWRYKEDAPLATRVVRAVFGSIDRRRVSTYSLVLREAMKQHILPTDLAQWIEGKNGIQEIRLSQSATFVSPKTKAETARQGFDMLAELAVVKTEALSLMADADFMGNDCVLLAQQQADGSFAVRAVLRQEGLVNAAFTALYAQQKAGTAATTKEMQAANDADGAAKAA